MVCKTTERANVPDAQSTTVCRDKNAIDGGLLLTLTSGGFSGIPYANVEAFTVIGGQVIKRPVQFGYLACRYIINN